jgi:16S rRNA A1518/A1519 N6-dimethyltransferase RsmA/KsgA/DIM1 with predicted DNA glycosylase/AP lyase activity
MRTKLLALALLPIAAIAQQPQTPEKLAPYFPTPEAVVERMLDTGQLKAGEKMFDLGSGDGRIVVMAAQKYHAIATGVELDNDLYIQSEGKILSLGLQKTARIIHGDILKQDYSSAGLITVYLLPESNLKLRPVLDAQLKKGTRIVAHDFPIGGWIPDKEITIADDGEGRSHTLYLYIH